MSNAEDLPRPLSRGAMAYVLAGGRGSRLMELTGDAPVESHDSSTNGLINEIKRLRAG